VGNIVLSLPEAPAPAPGAEAACPPDAAACASPNSQGLAENCSPVPFNIFDYPCDLGFTASQTLQAIPTRHKTRHVVETQFHPSFIEVNATRPML